MKICILQPYLTPYRVNFFNNIGQLNDGETIICYYSQYEKRRKWKENIKLENCKEIFLRNINIKIGYEKNIDLPNVFSIISFLKNERPDFIVCFPNTVGITFMLLSKLFKYQLFSWLECTNITEASTGFIKNKLRILFWNKVTTFIIPGIQTKIYLKSFGFPNKSQQLCFVPNSVDSEFQITKSELIKKFNPENDIINFYFSGSLILRKGIDLLLEALKIVNSEYKGGRSYKLHILGAGDLDLEQIDNIIYHGFKTGYDYLNIIKKSQVFILPSRSDCNPLTVIEALKNGCILILSKNVGNASDYIQDNGFILESLTARNISEKMIIILECSFEQIRKMSYCSYEFGKNITHKNSAKSFISIMKQNIY